MRTRRDQREMLALGVFGDGSRLSLRIATLLERGREFSARVSKVRMATSAAALLGCLMACAFAPRMVAFAQEPKFEVASVKLSGPAEDVFGMFVYPGGRLTATNQTLRSLIRVAYGIEDFQIMGGPSWAAEDHFSIEARPPAGSPSSRITPSNPKLPPPEEELAMLRSLMAERFHLAVHEETKDGRIYELRAGPKGPKLDVAKDPNDFPVVTSSSYTGNPDRPVIREGINVSMALLAAALSQNLRLPVVDRTGLNGAFDFKFYLERSTDGVRDAPMLTRGIEVLGLTLAPARGPVRYLTIDHAERPDAN